MSKTTLQSRNLIPDNTLLAGRDMKKVSIGDLTKNEKTTKEKKDNKSATLNELEIIKKTANGNFTDTINSYFGSDTPKLWLTLTFRDKRIVNGTNVDYRIRTEQELNGYIPEHQLKFYERDHQANVGVARTTRAIKDFFYRGQYMFKTLVNTDRYGIKHYKVHRTASLYDISKKFFYVVELGSYGKRRHIHALVSLRNDFPKDSILSENLINLKKNKMLATWQKNEGFFKMKNLKKSELDQKYAYMSKQQYILKDFNRNQFDNYNELFGIHESNKFLSSIHHKASYSDELIQSEITNQLNKL
tara:strand:+ start:964 stop:1869 length:906 start_codon:yes stop_codon:yes gene_type:complete